MSKKWSQGDPVDLTDLIRITPLANEVLHLAEELNMSCYNVMWIVSRIISGDNAAGDESEQQLLQELWADAELDCGLDEDEWEEIDSEMMREEMEPAPYRVDVAIAGAGRFQEIGFHAGLNDHEDIKVFFDLIMEMLDKLD